MSSRPPPGAPAGDEAIGGERARDEAPAGADEEALAEALVERLRASLDDRPDVALASVRARPATRAQRLEREGIEILGYDGRDGSGLDAWFDAIHEGTSPLQRFARLLEHRRILWVDPRPASDVPAFVQLARAAALAGREGTALVRVATADEGLARLAQAEARDGFDLALTHWGAGAARDEAGASLSAAERLLAGVRARDLRCPVVVFAGSASAEEAERRKRLALGLGAQDYCSGFETLCQAIERVLAPAAETA